MIFNKSFIFFLIFVLFGLLESCLKSESGKECKSRKSINNLQYELLDIISEVFIICTNILIKYKSVDIKISKIVIDKKIYDLVCDGMLWIDKNKKIIDDQSNFDRDCLESEIINGNKILKLISNISLEVK